MEHIVRGCKNSSCRFQDIVADLFYITNYTYWQLSRLHSLAPCGGEGRHGIAAPGSNAGKYKLPVCPSGKK